MSEKLKPCPFCGEAHNIRNRPMNYDYSCWAVTCDGCDVEGPWRFSEEESRLAWNQRSGAQS